MSPIKKVLVYKCRDYCEQLVDRLLEEFGDVIVNISISGESIRIVIDDSRFGSASVPIQIKDILSEFTTSRTGVNDAGWRRIAIRHLQKLVRKPIMPDLLVRILNKSGYSSKLDDDALVTVAEIDVIEDIISRIADCISSLSFKKTSSIAKKAIIYLCATRGIDIDKAIDILIDSGVLTVEEGRIIAREDLDNLIEWIDKNI